MLVVIVSECQGAAWTRSRRLLDRCLERIGDRTWRGRITDSGLSSLREELLKVASKTTSIAAHLVRGMRKFELLWVVGSTANFDDSGQYAAYLDEPPIKSPSPALCMPQAFPWLVLAVELAGLWHDIGKAVLQFQIKINKKGRKKKYEEDDVRHEILSNQAFVLTMRTLYASQDFTPASVEAAISGAIDKAFIFSRPDQRIDLTPVDLPPAIRHAAWIIATHHRLPMAAELHIPIDESGRFTLEKHCNKDAFDTPVICVINPAVITPSLINRTSEILTKLQAATPATLPDWRIVLGYARLSFILADRVVSKANVDESFHPAGPMAKAALKANTIQFLDEHLAKVSAATPVCLSDVHDAATAFPSIDPAGLPRQLREKSAGPFAWQNDAVDLIKAHSRRTSQDHPAATAKSNGFFGVLAASADSGKTRAAVKIMAALTPNLRYTLALSQRSLTLQVGAEYRRDLDLSSKEVKTIIGGGAVSSLHGNDPESDASTRDHTRPYNFDLSEGLETDDENLKEKGDLFNLPAFMMKHIEGDAKAHHLLGAPIVVATIDQLMAAADMRRTSYIIAALRLASSDLIIDEVDNFDDEDLIAIGRLVHLAGIFGRKILICSASLPPALAAGFFNAYVKGYRAHAAYFGKTGSIDVGFFADAPGSNLFTSMADPRGYADIANQFYRNLAARNDSKPLMRFGDYLPRESTREATFGAVLDKVHEFHDCHHVIDQRTGKRFSTILTRFARIENCVAFSKFIENQNVSANIAVVVYHSQFPLLVRNEIEQFLDAVLCRGRRTVADEPRLDAWLSASPNKDNILLVIASPVEEIGRDHDFDAAIIEPSSTQSIIRCSSLVNGHRLRPITAPNIALMPTSLAFFKNDGLVYSLPGVESWKSEIWPGYRLASPWIDELTVRNDLGPITAKPRLETANHGDMAAMEHAKIAEFLSGNRYYSLANYCSDKTRAFLAGAHANKIRFRNGIPQFEVFFNPTTNHFCNAKTCKAAKSLISFNVSAQNQARTLLDLDPARLLKSRFELENSSPCEIVEKARRYLKMSLRDFDTGTYTYDINLGAMRNILAAV